MPWPQRRLWHDLHGDPTALAAAATALTAAFSLSSTALAATTTALTAAFSLSSTALAAAAIALAAAAAADEHTFLPRDLGRQGDKFQW